MKFRKIFASVKFPKIFGWESDMIRVKCRKIFGWESDIIQVKCGKIHGLWQDTKSFSVYSNSTFRWGYSYSKPVISQPRGV